MSGASEPSHSSLIDFDAAALFLQQARDAEAKGDEVLSLAARKLVAIALDLTDSPRSKFQTGHLKA